MSTSDCFAARIFLYVSLYAFLLIHSSGAIAQYTPEHQSWLRTCEPEMQVVLSKTLGGLSDATSMRIQMSRDVIGTANASMEDIKSWVARGPGGENPALVFDYCLNKARLATESSPRPSHGHPSSAPPLANTTPSVFQAIQQPAWFTGYQAMQLNDGNRASLYRKNPAERAQADYYYAVKELEFLTRLKKTEGFSDRLAMSLTSAREWVRLMKEHCESQIHQPCPVSLPGAAAASEGRASSKCPAANEACPPPKGTQLRHTVKLGNACISVELLNNVLNYNNAATVELTNNCPVAQVIVTQSYLDGSPQIPYFFTYIHGPKYYRWFGKYPPEFPFSAVEPGLPFTMYPGNNTTLNFDGGHTIIVQTAACDYAGTNKIMNRIYTDFGLYGFTQMACRPNPEPPLRR